MTAPAPDMPPPRFIGSQIYARPSYDGAHPLAIPRVPTVMALARAMGWLPGSVYLTSPRAKPEALRTFHTRDYLDALLRAETSQSLAPDDRERHGLGTLSNPVHPLMYRRPATAAGGSLLGAELIANGGVVYNPGGGTHHGHADRAGGFCYLNDPVLAIQRLRALGLSRVAYVDIDAHHCDGVEDAFVGDDAIRIVSIHEAKRWPFTGTVDDTAGGVAFNIPAPRGFNDTGFDYVLEDLILPAVADHRPDAIVLQCGADAVLEDPLSRLALSNGSHWRAVRALGALAPRMLVLGGGGYNPWSVGRLWTGVWATLSGAEIPGPDDALPAEAQQILRTLTWRRAAGRNPPEHWFTTLADHRRDGEIHPDLRDTVTTLRKRLHIYH
ncbi:acetoin utilization protein AcuC [Chachezhania antarctica]|uniref:acetoin utilization protein AcuC n=1 Tax=Chachezhania antarctica TaxID=2340860 RepID=UPI001F093E5F|nr:acetoin utilization protein AcuC [Chachezhania antarctica]